MKEKKHLKEKIGLYLIKEEERGKFCSRKSLREIYFVYKEGCIIFSRTNFFKLYF